MPGTGRLVALRLGVAVPATLLVLALFQLIFAGSLAAGYPYDLDYGEGIVWQQMINIVAGAGYAPIGVFPAIVYHYPPVYHLVVGAIAAAFGSDGLATGRIVSLVSTLVSIGLVARLAFAMLPAQQPRGVRLLAAAFAGGCLAISPPIVHWSSLMRVDMLAGAFSLAGLVLTLGATTRTGRIALAAVCFVLAIYTKQTSIAAPAAAFVALWLARPRAAWMLFAWCATLGLCLLVALSVTSDGGFLRHTLLYNLNRPDLSRGQIVVYGVLAHIAPVTIAVLGIIAACRTLRSPTVAALRATLSGERAPFAAVLLLAFLIIKTAMLPTILKSGSNDNYLIEWLYALSVFIGIGVLPLAEGVVTGKRWPSLLLIAMVTVGVPMRSYDVMAAFNAGAMQRSYAPIVARIARASRPVVSDGMVLLIRGGQPVRWEPAIAAELGHAGRYDEIAFARLVRAHKFGFFVTAGDRGDRLYDERYNPVVADAIDAAYPRRERYADLVLHLPR